MVLIFEVAGPFRLRPKAEKFGPLRRWIWGLFSVAYISAGFNDISKAIRQDERERVSDFPTRTNQIEPHEPLEDCDCHSCALVYRNRYRAALAAVS